MWVILLKSAWHMLPNKRIMPSDPPEIQSVPLWLNAVQFIHVGTGSNGSWRWERKMENTCYQMRGIPELKHNLFCHSTKKNYWQITAKAALSLLCFLCFKYLYLSITNIVTIDSNRQRYKVTLWTEKNYNLALTNKCLCYKFLKWQRFP